MASISIFRSGVPNAAIWTWVLAGNAPANRFIRTSPAAGASRKSVTKLVTLTTLANVPPFSFKICSNLSRMASAWAAISPVAADVPRQYYQLYIGYCPSGQNDERLHWAEVVQDNFYVRIPWFTPSLIFLCATV